MLLFTRIRKHERGIRLRYGDYRSIVKPGRVWTLSRLFSRTRDRIEIHDTLKTRFEHALLDVIAADPAAREELLIVELTEGKRALLWRDGRLAAILGPGRHAFWKAPAALRVETYDVSSLRFEHEQMEAILAHADASKHLLGAFVESHEEALLYVSGRLVERLGEGRHVFWQAAGRIRLKAIDKREQVADVAGQEIMTSDKVTLRVNLIVSYQVTDSIKAVTVVSDHAQALYREAQLALRAAIGTRSLDALLGDKESIGGEVKNALASRAYEFGVAVRSVGLRDIILPGEMKTILNQVITAEKEAQANLIRRREETAAARSQANTARLLAESPVLARMRELEALQAILSGAKTTIVFGQGDLASQVKTLIREEHAS
jgi:regulator of protease activity HflC (stomatin/prohibitin superfamily)